jgi:hypothetical protein
MKPGVLVGSDKAQKQGVILRYVIRSQFVQNVQALDKIVVQRYVV